MRGGDEVHEFVKTIEEYQEKLEKMSKDDFRKLLDISGQIFDQLQSNDIKASKYCHSSFRDTQTG